MKGEVLKETRTVNLRLVSLVMSILFTFEFIALGIPTTAIADSEDLTITESGRSYEESSKLPQANRIKIENVDNIRGVQTYSMEYPDSISDYKKLGYSNFQYSEWSGYEKVLGTKSKRVAKTIVTSALGLAIPSKKLAALIAIYDISDSLKKQHDDVRISVNSRNIMAYTPKPDSYEVLIGEESIVKYYSDSKRTNLIKTVHRTNYVG